MGLMVSPPKPGDISYDQFVRERIKISQKLYFNSKGILESLRRRARIMTDGFNSCKNIDNILDQSKHSNSTRWKNNRVVDLLLSYGLRFV
ncbi:hypothetical protein YC2023_051580 [Brassica napus]